jgi:hydrogenase maturation factor
MGKCLRLRKSDDMKITDRDLFLRYAIPCGDVLVKRGNLKQETLDRIRKRVIRKERVEDDLERVFPIAVRMCRLIAKKLGKGAIDPGIIRQYFWHEHAKAVEWRAEIYPDLPKEKCLTYPARVLKPGKKPLLETPVGERRAKPDFVPGLKKDDWVIVHYDYIVEKIPWKEAEKLLAEESKIKVPGDSKANISQETNL